MCVTHAPPPREDGFQKATAGAVQKRAPRGTLTKPTIALSGLTPRAPSHRMMQLSSEPVPRTVNNVPCAETDVSWCTQRHAFFSVLPLIAAATMWTSSASQAETLTQKTTTRRMWAGGDTKKCCATEGGRRGTSSLSRGRACSAQWPSHYGPSWTAAIAPSCCVRSAANSPSGGGDL